MKLDRNINANGRGKYALVSLRKLATFEPTEAFGDSPVMDAIGVLDKEGLIEWGETGTIGEFFVIKLRDAYAKPALEMYARTAIQDGNDDFGSDVKELSKRASWASPFCKRPD